MPGKHAKHVRKVRAKRVPGVHYDFSESRKWRRARDLADR